VSLFSEMSRHGHEEVAYCANQEAGLKALIAIHNTALGPALGGLRMWPYDSEEEALNDVLRLSRGMSYKAAVAGLNLGGGKAVIIGDPKKDKSETLFRAFGRFVESLNGRYITAEDVSIDVNDLEYVFQETEHVVGVHQVHGGSGDPSPFTAYGVMQAIRASLQKRFGNEEVGRYAFAVQGVGHVGWHTAKMLREEGAKAFVCDIDEDKVTRAVEELGCERVDNEEVYDVEADVFTPSALGAVLNEDTIPRLGFGIVAGSANNQLADEACGDELHRRGILYAPDYAANAGGLMNVAIELEGYDRDRAVRMTRTIYYNVGRIFQIADRDGIPTWRAADRMAEERIAAVSRLQIPFLGHKPRRFAGRRGH
jgi:leucine dehydrogenase